MNKLAVFVNNELVFEFDRDLTLEDQQLAFLDKVDSDMESGIKVKGELLKSPDGQQRATSFSISRRLIEVRKTT